MALWTPGPWDEDDEPATQPESPHQHAYMAAEPKKPRRKRAVKTQTTSD